MYVGIAAVASAQDLQNIKKVFGNNTKLSYLTEHIADSGHFVATIDEIFHCPELRKWGISG
jgi:hypothetical protein